jgi:hypothetical protein
LESIPSSRAITLRNLTTGRGVTASEQPTAMPIWQSHWRWFALAGALGFLILVFLLFRGGEKTTTAASPVPSESAAATGSGSASPPSSVVSPGLKPVPLDELPAERRRTWHGDGTKHPSNGAPRKGSGDPFARRQ